MRGFWLVVLAGCYHPSPPDGIACNEALECPSPLHCDRGVCVRVSTAPDAAADALVDAPGTCMPVPSAAFAPPVLSALSSTSSDGTPTLTADLLDVYFKSTRAGGMGMQDLWHAHRTSVTAAWSVAAPVTELNTIAGDASPEISGDGLTLWFSSNRPGGLGDYDIYVATRTARDQPFGTPAIVTELSSAALDEGLLVLPSGLVAYFHSARSGINTIYRTTRTSTSDPWSAPTVVAELAAFGDNANPWVSPDDCTMYFASNHAGGFGKHDLFVATRGVPGAPFGTPQPLTSLDSASDDEDPWLSADQQTILIVSDRPAAAAYHIYESSR